MQKMQISNDKIIIDAVKVTIQGQPMDSRKCTIEIPPSFSPLFSSIQNLGLGEFVFDGEFATREDSFYFDIHLSFRLKGKELKLGATCILLQRNKITQDIINTFGLYKIQQQRGRSNQISKLDVSRKFWFLVTELNFKPTALDMDNLKQAVSAVIAEAQPTIVNKDTETKDDSQKLPITDSPAVQPAAKVDTESVEKNTNGAEKTIKETPKTTSTPTPIVEKFMQKQTSDGIQIPQDFLCPISGQLMSDPVVAGDGETYERENIKKHIEESLAANNQILSPRAQEKIEPGIVPNKILLNQIKKYIEANPSVLEHIHFPIANFAKAIAAINDANNTALKELIEADKRILQRGFQEHGNKSLLELTCEKGNGLILELVLSALKAQYPKSPLSDNKAKLLISAFKNPKLGNAGVGLLEKAFEWTAPDKHAFILSEIAKDNIHLLEALVKSGSIGGDEIMEEKEGNTLLHLTAQNNKADMVHLLIQLGANSKLQNKEHLLPENLASGDLPNNIRQWRSEKKLEPLTTIIEAQTKEIAALKASVSALLEMRRNKEAGKTIQVPVEAQPESQPKSRNKQ